MGCTGEHGGGLLDGLRDVAQAAELGALGVGPRQGGHGLDGAQVVLQLQDERFLLAAGLHGRRELALQSCIAACRGQKWEGRKWVIEAFTRAHIQYKTCNLPASNRSRSTQANYIFPDSLL